MVAKTTSTRAKKPSAWIVSPKDKGRKSIKKGKVFLNNGDEFEIELFNPLTECVLADIKLNGQSISKTGLVLKPGQRFYLDCFVDDKKKFIFSTYEIEANLESIEATQKNGLLEVFFYKEDVITLDNWKKRFDRVIVERWYPTYYPNWYPNWYQPYYPNTIVYGGTTTIGTGGYGSLNAVVSSGTATFNSGSSTTGAVYGTTTNTIAGNFNVSNLTGTLLNPTSLTSGDMTPINSSMETGRVEKGSASSQKFTEIDMEFEDNYISSTIIQIFPESVKPIETKDILFDNIKGTLTSVRAKDILKNESDEIIDLIKKLSELHSAGILTDEEFSDKKSELLSKI